MSCYLLKLLKRLKLLIPNTTGLHTIYRALQEEVYQLLSEKWRRPYSSTFGYVKSRMSIAVAHTTNLCLRGTRIKNHSLDNRRYLWDEEGLYRLHNQHF